MARTRAAAGLTAVATAGGVLLAACGGPARPTASSRPGSAPRPPAATASTSQPAAHPAAAWPTFDRVPARSGVATGLPAAGALSVAWRSHLDGSVYGQPLVVGNDVIAATENDSLYALNETTGRVVWRTHVGSPVPLSDLPCGDIDPLGITGTPVYDRGNGLVYAVAETSGYRHVLVGVSVATGTVRVRRMIATPDGEPRYDQQRSGLALDDGRVYVAFGGLYGDCGPYVGSVVSVPASGTGALVSYKVPTSKGGAIWGTAGPVTAADGTLYVATGNGAAASGRYDDSDSVTALSPSLHRSGVFAPSTWAADNADDFDLGSTQPALLPDGRLLQVGKRGVGYLVRAGHLGGVGGQIAETTVCPAYGATAVQGDTVYEPCRSGGLAAVTVSGDHLSVRWRGPAGTDGSPVVGGGALWVTQWPSGVLDELNPASGAVRASVHLGATLPHFASASLAGSRVFVGTNDGVTAVRGA